MPKAKSMGNYLFRVSFCNVSDKIILSEITLRIYSRINHISGNILYFRYVKSFIVDLFMIAEMLKTDKAGQDWCENQEVMSRKWSNCRHAMYKLILLSQNKSTIKNP